MKRSSLSPPFSKSTTRSLLLISYKSTKISMPRDSVSQLLDLPDQTVLVESLKPTQWTQKLATITNTTIRISYLLSDLVNLSGCLDNIIKIKILQKVKPCCLLTSMSKSVTKAEVFVWESIDFKHYSPMDKPVRELLDHLHKQYQTVFY